LFQLPQSLSELLGRWTRRYCLVTSRRWSSERQVQLWTGQRSAVSTDLMRSRMPDRAY